MLPELTPNQFRTFLLLYAAHVDYELTDEEVHMIQSNSNDDDYNDMLALFNGVNDYRALKIIMHHKQILLNDSRTKEDVYKQLKELFKSDGNFTRPEKVFLQFLDKMIHTQD